MKKALALVVMLVLVASVSFAQAYKVGDQVVQGGIGFGMAGIYGDASLPPISVGYEQAMEMLEGKLSVGGLVGFAGSSQEFSVPAWSGTGIKTYTWKYNYSYIILGARGAYHYDFLNMENVDTYGGLLLGYNIVSSSVEGTAWAGGSSASGSYLAIGGFVGGRYYFSSNLAAYAELGYGIGFLNLGVSYKL